MRSPRVFFLQLKTSRQFSLTNVSCAILSPWIIPLTFDAFTAAVPYLIVANQIETEIHKCQYLAQQLQQDYLAGKGCCPQVSNVSHISQMNVAVNEFFSFLSTLCWRPLGSLSCSSITSAWSPMCWLCCSKWHKYQWWRSIKLVILSSLSAFEIST